MSSASRMLLGLAFISWTTAAPIAIAHADEGGDTNAPCGSVSGDADQVAAVRAQAAATCDCATASSHGAYVSCVAQVVNDAVDSGALRSQCRGDITHCAARSTCGKPGFVTCCRTSAKGKKKCSIKRNADACRAPAGGSASVGTSASCCDACAGGTTTTTIVPPPTTTSSSTSTTHSTSTSSPAATTTPWTPTTPSTSTSSPASTTSSATSTTPSTTTSSPASTTSTSSPASTTSSSTSTTHSTSTSSPASTTSSSTSTTHSTST